jgi:hemolysin D
MSVQGWGDNLTGAWDRLVKSFDQPDEREFLPAALEVLETPPSPLGRTIAFLIMAFFLVAIVWAFFGKVDVLATAPGRIAPAGEVKVIQPSDPGVVHAISVQDGQHVRAGQVLIELDPTQTQADQDKLARALMQARLDVARLTALKASIDTGRPPRFTPPQGASADEVEAARAAMFAQYDQEQAKVANLTQEISQKNAELAEAHAQIDKTNAQMPILVEKNGVYDKLLSRGFGTKLAALDVAQQLSDARHDLNVEAQRAAQAADAKSAQEKERDGVRSQYTVEVLGDLSKAQEQANELSQELVKAQDKSAHTQLRSPIDGVVDQLSVHTLGGVVMPAQHLMIVVPDGRDLTVQARLSNRDVGFVHAGQPVKIKVETFNFTRYGLIDGQVTSVSRDVVASEPQGDGTQAAPPPAARAGSPAYVARIALARTDMMVDKRRELLMPGMSITAEIKTGRRTVIDYLLSPLARRTSESLHER